MTLDKEFKNKEDQEKSKFKDNDNEIIERDYNYQTWKLFKKTIIFNFQ
jgi:hypothetical protein